MDNINSSYTAQDVGYLVVRVSTARGAIPLENAAVSIRGGTPESSGILYSLTTNSDGLTDRVELPAPPRSLSASPTDSAPYSLWTVDVFKEGYMPVSYQNLPVYASIVSVQPAVLLPIAEGYTAQTVINESGAPSL